MELCNILKIRRVIWDEMEGQRREVVKVASQFQPRVNYTAAFHSNCLITNIGNLELILFGTRVGSLARLERRLKLTFDIPYHGDPGPARR